MTSVKRRGKDFPKPWIEGEREAERERGRDTERKSRSEEGGEKTGNVQSRRLFLGGQYTLILAYKCNARRWGKKEKHHFQSHLWRQILVFEHMVEHMKHENSTNYLHPKLASFVSVCCVWRFVLFCFSLRKKQQWRIWPVLERTSALLHLGWNRLQ